MMTATQTVTAAARASRPTALGLALLAALTLACATAAADGDWELLGTRKVDHGLDRDEIRVGAREGTLSKLKLRVRDRGVHFRDLEVHFANGRVQDVAIRARIPAGGESRVIDLVGDDRVVEKVVFWYSTRHDRRGRATVELWGRE
jgi:hypothetical protein